MSCCRGPSAAFGAGSYATTARFRRSSGTVLWAFDNGEDSRSSGCVVGTKYFEACEIEDTGFLFTTDDVYVRKFNIDTAEVEAITSFTPASGDTAPRLLTNGSTTGPLLATDNSSAVNSHFKQYDASLGVTWSVDDVVDLDKSLCYGNDLWVIETTSGNGDLLIYKSGSLDQTIQDGPSTTISGGVGGPMSTGDIACRVREHPSIPSIDIFEAAEYVGGTRQASNPTPLTVLGGGDIVDADNDILYITNTTYTDENLSAYTTLTGGLSDLPRGYPQIIDGYRYFYTRSGMYRSDPSADTNTEIVSGLTDPALFAVNGDDLYVASKDGSDWKLELYSVSTGLAAWSVRCFRPVREGGVSPEFFMQASDLTIDSASGDVLMTGQRRLSGELGVAV